MKHSRISALCIFLIVGAPAIAVEPTAQPQISGKCTLTKWVGDDSKLETTGKITAIPKGVGFEFLSEEFLVPGEERGSNRYTLPKGIHFRISPARIDEETSVVDVLLTHTTIDAQTDDGFSTSSTQTDTRQIVKYGKPFSVSLQMPDSKVRYKLEIILQRQ